ncbi:ABC transporter ATP-binding protein [Gloeocapsa sp. PCC 73106]|uniref:ABC transporter ATP-binding protein n=1 Tax=Gloeocapsa sp. PCC 73106 TaxID=102232 RepID=UPI0002AC3C63|nr:ABC transporter ATP-binding protein [Gloeocapsa sp. PCC 73106]ELR99067.1 ABC-type bacteriocin/lantibiotic exporter with N-terminal double-glycine peptidase domain [Gloeocapsa sp. PCC 73106]
MLNYFKKIAYILGKDVNKIPLLILVFIISSLLDVLGVIIVGPYTKIVTEPEFLNSLESLNKIFSYLNIQTFNHKIILLTLVVLIILLVQVLVLIASQIFLYKTSGYLQHKVVVRLFSAYVNVPYKFIVSESSASLTNFIQESDLAIRANLISLLQITTNSILLFSLLFVLVKTSVTLLVLIIGVLAVVFVTLDILGKRVKKAGKVRVEERKKNISVINHTFGGFKETRVIGCEKYFENLVKGQQRKIVNAEMTVGIVQQLPGIVTKSSLVLVLILFIGLSVTVLNKNTYELTPILSVFAVAGVRLSPSFNIIVQSLNLIKNQSYALDTLYLKLKEIEKLHKRERRRIQQAEKRDFRSFGELALVDVSYTYPGSSQPSLQNISFKLNKGESIGIIGKSGAGKTTLIDVILGLLQPDNGDIEVDGLSVYHSLRSWQDTLGYIPQTIFLTEDTIEKNIAFGVPDQLIDREKIARVLKMTELEELIASLPQGIKTEVGERGVRLSGGQRQRIGIARALYHEREILVLDEATSALDSQTENLITEAIKSLVGNQTLIIIAHRLTTLRHCDRVCLLEKGRLIKTGSYAEVVSEYESKYQSQANIPQEVS